MAFIYSNKNKTKSFKKQSLGYASAESLKKKHPSYMFRWPSVGEQYWKSWTVLYSHIQTLIKNQPQHPPNSAYAVSRLLLWDG